MNRLLLRAPRALLRIVALIALIAAPRVARAQGFIVIVNASNRTTAISRDQASRLFLGKISAWPNGRAVVPVDQSPRSSARTAFTTTVHARPVDAVKAYWQQQLFAHREMAPPEKASDDEVVAFVSARAGAIGYVSPGAELTSGVRIITIQ